MPPLTEPPSELGDDRVVVDRVLDDFLTAKQRHHSGPSVGLFVDELREFLAGGKRLRPLLCCCGWRAAGGQGRLPLEVAQVAASLELFHAFALIHDDVMDDSHTRRGRAAVHRRFSARHKGHPAADRLGINAAILLGDLALAWSCELVQTAALTTTPHASAVWDLLDTMRTETLTGQYLDLVAEGTSQPASTTF